MSVVARVSNKNADADTNDPRELSFSSEYYMSTIGKTGFKDYSSQSFEHHFLGYIPAVIVYDDNGIVAFKTGANLNRIRFGVNANSTGKDRYYLLHQPV